jgi:hypothetical protein
MIQENIQSLEKHLEAACARAGRKRDEITLVAVSKTFGVELMREALTAGLRDFGENYVQELISKNLELSGLSPRWHFIGHLQSNKVKYIAGYVHLIHSVDNMKLAREIDKRGAACGRTLDVLVEVHTTDEATKSGVLPERAIGLVQEMAGLAHLRVQGLMTMGPFSDNPNDSRPCFRLVAALAREIDQAGIEGVRMKKLSMGMSSDFEVAIEEGATIVRIGTAVFGQRKKYTESPRTRG